MGQRILNVCLYNIICIPKATIMLANTVHVICLKGFILSASSPAKTADIP